jgi:murein L,D-transpeptidase YcbB/YkuD
MKKGLVFISVSVVSVLFLSGCATMGRNVTQENDNLKVQIQDLQSQLQKKDAEISSLRQALGNTTEERYKAAKLRAVNREGSYDHPAGKDIQTALKNAGFDPGTFDGKLGKKSRQAIRDFQRANGLDVDGKVGKKTWELLAPYLEKTASN